jgi:hypothetical protein
VEDDLAKGSAAILGATAHTHAGLIAAQADEIQNTVAVHVGRAVFQVPNRGIVEMGAFREAAVPGPVEHAPADEHLGPREDTGGAAVGGHAGEIEKAIVVEVPKRRTEGLGRARGIEADEGASVERQRAGATGLLAGPGLARDARGARMSAGPAVVF